MQNWDETLLSQYFDSPTIYSLLESYNDAIDPANDIVNFYQNIWNVNTAVGSGLDIWGAIVNVSRYLQIPETPNYFGFGEAYLSSYASTGPQPFGQAPFYLSTQITQSYYLSDDIYRRLIMVKSAINIGNLSVPDINQFLQYFFGTSIDGSPSGIVYIIDNLNNSFTYHFNFIPTDWQLAIIENSGVFPRPAGISVNVTY